MDVARTMEEAEREAGKGILTESQVRKHLRRCYEVATGESMQFHSVDEWFDLWLSNKRLTKQVGTVTRYAGSVGTFLRTLGKRRNLDLRHLDTNDIVRFRDHLVSSGKSNKSINSDITSISVALNLAARQGVIERNPAQTLDPLPTQPGVRKPFNREQVEMILRHASGDWLGLSLVAYYTGMRLSDATNLEWSEVQLIQKIPVIRFVERKKQTKHRREIVVPIHSRLIEHFLSLPRGRKGDPVFPSLADRSSGGKSGLSQSFKRILLKAGIVDELYSQKKIGSVARKVSPYGFHSFRHTFKSELANRGVPKEIYDTLTGHAKPSVAEIYVHREVDALSASIEKLPTLKVA
jgi:integrase